MKISKFNWSVKLLILLNELTESFADERKKKSRRKRKSKTSTFARNVFIYYILITKNHLHHFNRYHFIFLINL